MSLQLLISALEKNPSELIAQMNIASDAIIVNQKAPWNYEEIALGQNTVRVISCLEKGVGLSRNTALMRADHELSLIADEDIVYDEGYEKLITDEFAKHPEADMLLFNVKVDPGRKTYWTEAFHRVRWYNCGRYPAYSFAFRTDRIHEKQVTYHLWFGGGCRYANGEDSLFINDCLKAGLKVYATPVCIGEEKPRANGESTWFNGYTRKFFHDRGVLYHYLYGAAAPIMAMRWLHKFRGQELADGLSFAEAKKEMKKGIKYFGK